MLWFDEFAARKVDDFKEDAEVIDDTTPAKSLDLPADAREVFGVLGFATYQYYSLRNMDFREMSVEHKINHGESLVGADLLFLADTL